MKINKKFDTQAGHDAAPFQSSAQKPSAVEFNGLYFATPEDREFFGCGTAAEHERRIKQEHAAAKWLLADGVTLELCHLRVADYHRWRVAEGLPDGACVRLDYALRAPRLADPATRTAFGLTPWVPPLSPANTVQAAELAEEDRALRNLQVVNRGAPSPLKLTLIGVTREAPAWIASAVLRADLRFFLLSWGMADWPLEVVFGALWSARAAFEGSSFEAPAADLAMRYTRTMPPVEVEDLKAHVLPPNSLQRIIYQAMIKQFAA